MKKRVGKRKSKEKRLARERRASQYSSRLRECATPAEKRLFDALTAQQWKFAFQSSLFTHGKGARHYIADFRLWLPSGRPLVVEVDGGYHRERRGYDAARTAWLQRVKQATVVRFTNDQVFNDIERVIAELYRLKPVHDPLKAIEITPRHRREIVGPDMVAT